MSNKKSVSVRDIAEMCNVSPATVSRVINNSGRISAATRERVLQAIRDNDYSLAPNVRKLSSEKLVGISFPYTSNHFHSSLLSSLEKALKSEGYSSVIMMHFNDVEYEQNNLKIMSELNVAGILIIPAKRQVPDIFQRIFPNTPSVFLETEPNENCFTVNSDQYVGGQLAAAELLRKGCTRPVVLAGRSTHISKNQRVRGFTDAFTARNISISPDNILICNKIKGSFTEAKDLLKYACVKGNEFDCVFADSDWKAFGALVALQEMGYDVPDDIKIVGYDASDIAKYTFQPITSVSQEVSQISDMAVKVLLKQINHTKLPHKNNVIPVSLYIGKTT